MNKNLKIKSYNKLIINHLSLIIRKAKGFTLIELLIVIAIIGILSAIAMFALSGTQAKARDGQRKADLAKIQSALELYRSDKGNYPNQDRLPKGASCSDGSFSVDNNGNCTYYLQTIPKDPLGNAVDYAYTASPTRCDNSTETGAVGFCTGYSLIACLETKASSDLNQGDPCSTSRWVFTVNNP